ncbi:hypothetical protein KP509_34G059900 [Ceratopteris richardii]|uniref:SGNH hydrolase-type esterase domain-containing protein n=1 Tax=Ceratopteris richardii TaxID=49495 RepID=A0A8T2QMN3_CERRI|nr:hypothetical protein KP509_34G059900 [Ceratopteris richardii]
MASSRHERPLFVLYGASMTEYAFKPGGWGASLAHLYCRKADILLRGYRGWNTRRALAAMRDILPQESQCQPALVVVFFGANDAAFPMPSGKGQYVPLEEFRKNLQDIASYLLGLSKTTRVILVTAPPVNEQARREDARIRHGKDAARFTDRTNERARKYAQACIEAAKAVNVGVVDLWTAIQKEENWQTECLSDGLHLTAKGNQILFDELVKVIEDANWTPSLSWKSMAEDYIEPSIYDFVHPSFEYSDDSYLQL